MRHCWNCGELCVALRGCHLWGRHQCRGPGQPLVRLIELSYYHEQARRFANFPYPPDFP